ncbi:hypothetical protein LXM50_01625 [Microbacterium sp. Au-Mic1]|uniref:hypothetical protein n=1 Tax=Microbacterium sp. Au-Mic1 TaxID=2906457 RepID=UPI001E6259CE|nr:hypothetical protein [Microbacterium sp. Au-Mic1]MCE4024666.1 hypothetical protein [Microbacterium sp. Au-Mic1]
MSLRKDIEALFREDWAEDPILSQLRVIATERELDQLAQDTALIRLKGLRREPTAPLRAKRVELLLTIISARTDLDRAGDDLEEYMNAAEDYLGPRFMHDAPSIVGYNDRLAIDIPLYITTTPAEVSPMFLAADTPTEPEE